MLLRVPDLTATHDVAAAIADLVRPGDLIVLAGEMGAGKTAFAQGFGRALGVTEPITSPTFTLVHSYPCPGKVTLHHADLYRLDRTGDVDDLALNELASFGGIVIVEWGDVAAAAFGDHLEVRLAFVDDDEPDDDEPDDDEPDGAGSASATDDGTDDDTHDDTHDDTDGAGDTRREIELHATGRLWAGRWDRLTSAVAGYRC